MTTATTKNNLAESAVYYAANMGWHVFPVHTPIFTDGTLKGCSCGKAGCENVGKHPRTLHGVDDATTDPDTIRGWWERWPGANIGLNCGASGLVVLDFDTNKEGFAGGELLENLLQNYPTVAARSGSGGYHLLYLQPDGATLGNGRGNLPAGVDVRGQRGYIVVAPSIHPSGNGYGWANTSTQKEIAPLPDFVRDMVRTKSTPAQTAHQNGGAATDKTVTPAYILRAVDDELATLARATEGNRNHSLNTAAFALGQLVGDGLLSRSEVVDKLTRTAAELGLPEREAAKTIQSGLKGGAAEPRGLRLATHTNGNGNGYHVPDEPPGWLGADDIPTESHAPAASATAQAVAAPKGKGGGGYGQAATWRDYVSVAGELGYSFRLNDLADSLEVNGERMTDVHEAVLLSKLHEKGLRSADVARRAFTTAGAHNRYHPVKEYLAGLKWDGKDHIDALSLYFTDTHEPITYADGTRRTVIHAFLRRWLLGAVGKVYDAKANQNPMLILDGAQGSGKSYFAKWVCPLPDLHFEGAIKPEDKDYSGYLSTRLVWEVGELGATMRKADREALKAFITQIEATYRPAYGRHSLVKPALASFIGTVNFEGALLSDPTGNRRFWPVTLAGLDWNYSRDMDKNQVWAQAYALYQAGEGGQLCAEERTAHSEIVQSYEVEDILAGFVMEHFRVEPQNTTFWTPTTEIISILRSPTGADLKGSERALSMQLSSTLNSLGLVRTRKRDGADNPRWGYAGIPRKL